MDLDITEFFKNANAFDYSASASELGLNAGRITWDHAVEGSKEYMILDSEEKREAFRSHVKGYGAWSEEKIRGWSDCELNALLLQFIAGDIRQSELDPENPDWEAYEAGADQQGSNLFHGTDGRIYYYIKN